MANARKLREKTATENRPHAEIRGKYDVGVLSKAIPSGGEKPVKMGVTAIA